MAAVNGVAAGAGASIALACDTRIASESARLVFPFAKVALVPDSGALWLLARMVGASRAWDIVTTGRMIDAAEAERAGLVSRVVPAAELLSEALRIAEAIASISLPTAMVIKESVNRAFETTLAEGLRHDRRAFQSLGAADQNQGQSSRLETPPATIEAP